MADLVNRAQMRKELPRLSGQAFIQSQEVLTSSFRRVGASDYRLAVDDVALLGAINAFATQEKAEDDETQTKLDTINASLGTINTSITTLNANLTTLLNEVKTALGGIDASIDETTAAVNDVNEDTESIDAKMDTTNTNINAVKTSVDAVTAAINDVKTDTEAINTATESIDDNLAVVKGFLTTPEITSISASYKHISGLSSELNITDADNIRNISVEPGETVVLEPKLVGKYEDSFTGENYQVDISPDDYEFGFDYGGGQGAMGDPNGSTFSYNPDTNQLTITAGEPTEDGNYFTLTPYAINKYTGKKATPNAVVSAINFEILPAEVELTAVVTLVNSDTPLSTITSGGSYAFKIVGNDADLGIKVTSISATPVSNHSGELRYYVTGSTITTSLSEFEVRPHTTPIGAVNGKLVDESDIRKMYSQKVLDHIRKNFNDNVTTITVQGA